MQKEHVMRNFILKLPENFHCKMACLWTKPENYLHVIDSTSPVCDDHHSIYRFLLSKLTKTTNSLRQENDLEFHSNFLPLNYHFLQLLNLLAIICSYTANFESDILKLCMQSQIQGARSSAQGMINFRVPSANAGSSLSKVCRNDVEETTVFNSTHKVKTCMPTVRVGCKFPRDTWLHKKWHVWNRHVWNRHVWISWTAI